MAPRSMLREESPGGMCCCWIRGIEVYKIFRNEPLRGGSISVARCEFPELQPSTRGSLCLAVAFRIESRSEVQYRWLTVAYGG